MNNKSIDLNNILKKIEDLPTLPNIINKIMKVLDNPYSNAEHLTEIISLDQSLTLKTLRLANSAYYGFPREIETVTEAVVVLGFLTVRNLILTTTLYNFFINDDKNKINFDRVKFWKHTIATAIIARKIVSYFNTLQNDEEEAFTMGILHDIGQAFLDIYFHDKFIKVLQKHSKEPNKLIIDIEDEILGINHCEIAAMIIDKWNLPVNFIEPIKHHHTPEKSKNNVITNVLYISNILSNFIGTDTKNEIIINNFNDFIKKNNEIKKINFEVVLKEAEQEFTNADLFINS